MKVIRPNTISGLVSSVPENEYPVWTSTATYSKGDSIIFEHRVYMSLINSNTGKIPKDTTFGVEAAWRDMGATNRYRMFDETLSTQTSISGSGEQFIEITMDFKLATALALFNMYATKLEVWVYEGEKTYYTRTVNLLIPVDDWWEWYFEDRDFLEDYVISAIPASRTAKVRIRIYGTDRVSVGHFLVGRERTVGGTKLEAKSGLRSFSKKDTDDFGNTRLLRGKTAKTMSTDVWLPTKKLDATLSYLTSMDAVLAVWIGDDIDTDKGGYRGLVVYGWMEEYEAVYSDVFISAIAITVQGLA